jgi:predicted negative regulator of RcsB-dependent stress response
MVSAAATAELAAQTMLDDKAFGPFVNVNVTNAEEDANSIAATFDSVQPPDAASDKLRNAVDTAMQAATSALADLRIAVRRRQLEEVRKALSDLTKARSELQKLETVA